jgi:hypothetical protein
MIFFKALLLMVGILAVLVPVLMLIGRLVDIIIHRLPLNDKWLQRLNRWHPYLIGLLLFWFLGEYAPEWAIVQDIVAWLYGGDLECKAMWLACFEPPL